MQPVETNAERRRRKLGELCAQHGGPELVAARSGLSAAALKQYLRAYRSSHTPKYGTGSPSERALGDTAARTIEAALGLERGWFDHDGDAMMTPQEVELVGIYRQLDDAARAAVLDTLRTTRDELAAAAERLRHGLRHAAPLDSEKSSR